MVAPYGKQHGLVRLAPSYLFLGPWTFQSLITFLLILAKLAHWAFSFHFHLLTHSRPILFSPKEGHPTMVGFSMLPIGQHMQFLTSSWVFLLFGPS